MNLGSLYPYDIVNRSGETIPSLSIVKLDTQGNATVNKRLMTGVTKPDGGGGLYLVTGPMAVEDDRYGKAALPVFPVWVRYSGTAPQQGDAVGPTEDAWTVSTDGTGLTVWQVDPTRQLVLASGSMPDSSGATIMFEIQSVDEFDGCDHVTAIVLGAPCTGGPDIGETVTVYDEAECFFNEPPEELIGRRGFAAKLKVEYTPYGGDPEYDVDTECRWVVHSLCCPEPI